MDKKRSKEDMQKRVSEIKDKMKKISARVENLKSFRVRNVAKDILNESKNFARNGFNTVCDEVFKERIAVCQSCEFWEQRKCVKSNFTLPRLKFENAKCPLGKWKS